MWRAVATRIETRMDVCIDGGKVSKRSGSTYEVERYLVERGDMWVSKRIGIRCGAEH